MGPTEVPEIPENLKIELLREEEPEILLITEKPEILYEDEPETLPPIRIVVPSDIPLAEIPIPQYEIPYIPDVTFKPRIIDDSVLMEVIPEHSSEEPEQNENEIDPRL